MRTPMLAFAPVLFALVVALIVPTGLIRPAYAVPALLPRDDFPAAEQIFSDPAAPEEQLTLIAASFPEVVNPGDRPQVALTLCAETALSRNWAVFVHLVSPAEIILAQADFFPGQGAIPTSQVAAGQCWHSHHRLRIAPGIVSLDTPLDVVVGFYDASGDMGRMILYDQPDATTYRLGRSLLAAGDELGKFSLDEAVRIVDFALSEVVASPGDTLTFDITWDVRDTLRSDYTVFVQVLDPQTTYRVAASDKAPQPPTSTWSPGDTITDVHTLVVDLDAPPGVYTVIVGMYEQSNPGEFRRLRVVYNGVDTGRDALVFTRVRVE